MLDLRNVLELVNDRLDNGPFAKQEFVHQGHQRILHVGANTRHELDIERAQQFVSQCFGDIAFIGEEFAKEFPNHLGNRLAIVDIARRKQQIEQLAAIIENQV